MGRYEKSDGGIRKVNMRVLCFRGKKRLPERYLPSGGSLLFPLKHLVLIFTFLISSHLLASQIIHLKVKGGIDPGVQSYIERGIQLAKTQQAEAVLIELNTPGGLLTATRNIVESMLNSTVPVIVFFSSA